MAECTLEHWMEIYRARNGNILTAPWESIESLCKGFITYQDSLYVPSVVWSWANFLLRVWENKICFSCQRLHPESTWDQMFWENQLKRWTGKALMGSHLVWGWIKGRVYRMLKSYWSILQYWGQRHSWKSIHDSPQGDHNTVHGLNSYAPRHKNVAPLSLWRSKNAVVSPWVTLWDSQWVHILHKAHHPFVSGLLPVFMHTKAKEVRGKQGKWHCWYQENHCFGRVACKMILSNIQKPRKGNLSGIRVGHRMQCNSPGLLKGKAEDSGKPCKRYTRPMRGPWAGLFRTGSWVQMKRRCERLDGWKYGSDGK